MKILKGILYWLISLTWGGIMTYIGLIVALCLLISGHKPKCFGYTFYFEVGQRKWGGLEFGGLFIVNKNSSMYNKCHEHGHGIQNCIFGPFEIFIWLASAIRYNYRNWLVKTKRKASSELPPYDDIWFESQATTWGYKYFC